jgi:tetratricopeptide (TPR) repeat protein
LIRMRLQKSLRIVSLPALGALLPSQFQLATTLDADYARAFVMSAACLALRRVMTWTSDIARESAMADSWVRSALRLDSRDPFVLSRAASVLSYVLGSVEESSTLLDRSLELDPNDAAAWTWCGWARLWLENPDEALERFKRSLRLNPLDPQVVFTHTGMAYAHCMLAQYPEAETWAKKALQELPNYPAAMRSLIATQALAGKIAEARQSLAAYLLVDPTARLSNMRQRYFRQRPGRVVCPDAQRVPAGGNAGMSGQRRLAAIVAADGAGYPRLMGRDESGTLAALKSLRREIVDPRVARYNGRA